jgi:hypothetical protein
MKRIGVTLLGLAALCASAAGAPALAAADPVLERLATWMAGSFSSATQAARDPDYRDIRLQVVPIWIARDDGPWLYVEQAAAASLDKPYRQRVYRLVRTGRRTIESRIFSLPDPGRFAGAWRDPAPLAALGPGDLAPKTGCEVVLGLRGKDAFRGSTVGKNCPSEHRGAAYATSEVTITSRGMASWDRGFDASGKQTWGAEKGPYAFAREN